MGVERAPKTGHRRLKINGKKSAPQAENSHCKWYKDGGKGTRLPHYHYGWWRYRGQVTCDVYLNDRAYWRNVPEGGWGYYIGGYQVINKWLSYREREVLGRDLRPDEARYVTEMVRRIAALLLLQPRLDENYQRIKQNTFDWSAVAGAD
jgi:hypothetical protein